MNVVLWDADSHETYAVDSDIQSECRQHYSAPRRCPMDRTCFDLGLQSLTGSGRKSFGVTVTAIPIRHLAQA